MLEVDSESLVVKCDHSTTVLIPDEVGMPYCCLDGVLMHGALTESKDNFFYNTTQPFVRLR
eukprot:457704-Pleurochrysis_carterae.AAC.1